MIPCIPTVLTSDILKNGFGAKTSDCSIPVGLTYSEVKPFMFNLSQMGAWGISGKEGSGHRNIVTYIVNSLCSEKKQKAEIVIFDDVSRKYAFLKDRTDGYFIGTDGVAEVIRRWHKELERRYDAMLLDENTEQNKLLLMIVQNNDVAAAIQKDMEMSDMYGEITGRFRDFGVGIIFANYPNSAISYDAPDAVRAIKQSRHLLYLDDLANLKSFDVPYEALRENKKPLSTGDGYYINDNDVTKLKLVLAD